MRFILPEKNNYDGQQPLLQNGFIIQSQIPFASTSEALSGVSEQLVLNPRNLSDKLFKIPIQIPNTSIPGVLSVNGVNKATVILDSDNTKYSEINSQDSVFINIPQLPNDLQIVGLPNVLNGFVSLEIQNFNSQSINTGYISGHLTIIKSTLIN